MPRITITAKYASTCPKCRQRIAIGTRINWSKGSSAEHVACPGEQPPYDWMVHANAFRLLRIAANVRKMWREAKQEFDRIEAKNATLYITRDRQYFERSRERALRSEHAALIAYIRSLRQHN